MSRGVKEWKADTAAFSLLQLIGAGYSNGFPNDSFQSAYQAGHSTETVLLRIVNDILSALDNNIFVLLLLDLSAAFDTVDHQILLSRLNCVLAFSLLHSNGFSHTSQTVISPLQSVTRLHHHHSSCMVCLKQFKFTCLDLYSLFK